MGGVHGVSHSSARIQTWLLNPIAQNDVVPADHVHDVSEAEEPGPVALTGGDLEVAGHAAAVCLRALERGLDQTV